VTYGCEAWVLSKDEWNKLKAFKTKCYRRSPAKAARMRTKHKIQFILADCNLILVNQCKSQKLSYFGHAVRHDSLEKDIILGMVLECVIDVAVVRTKTEEKCSTEHTTRSVGHITASRLQATGHTCLQRREGRGRYSIQNDRHLTYQSANTSLAHGGVLHHSGYPSSHGHREDNPTPVTWFDINLQCRWIVS